MDNSDIKEPGFAGRFTPHSSTTAVVPLILVFLNRRYPHHLHFLKPVSSFVAFVARASLVTFPFGAALISWVVEVQIHSLIIFPSSRPVIN